MATPAGTDIKNLTRALLDRGYGRAAATVLEALNRELLTGSLYGRLLDLETAARIAEAQGKPFRADKAEMRALLAELKDLLERTAREIEQSVAPRLEESALAAAAQLTKGLALRGLNDRQLAALGVRWNTPDPEAVAALVRYSSGLVWREELERYSQGVYEAVQMAAVRGLVLGKNPRTVAREVAQIVQTVPRYRAEALMRTLQLQAYRDATAVNLWANRDVVHSQIRIAVLDSRTCLACIAEHGTEMPVGARILDHHNGRCTAIGQVTGLERRIQTGEEWFASLPEEQRLAIAGPGAYELLISGRARLRDFVDTYEDRVFGTMLREANLQKTQQHAGLLPNARRYAWAQDFRQQRATLDALEKIRLPSSPAGLQRMLGQGRLETQFSYAEDVPEELRQRVAAAEQWLRRIVRHESQIQLTVKVLVNWENGARAYYDHADRVIALSPVSDVGTIVHELGHALEMQLRKVGQATEFLLWRSEARYPRRLSELTGQLYREDEYAVPDRWHIVYTGKSYRDESGQFYATEVLSTGLEALYKHGVEQFVQQDRQHAQFVLSMLGYG